MHFHHDPLERKAALRGAFPFLDSKHALGLSFELSDHPLTTCELSPELQQCLGTALDKHQEKVLHVDMGFFLWNMHVPAPNMRF
jgi:hypothetical protein